MSTYSIMTWVLTALLTAIVAFHLLLSPYTKVEESFTMQAVHDMLNYGVLPDLLAHYDHQQFPGVVPRTFVGSAVLAGIVGAADAAWKYISGAGFVADGPHAQLHVQVAVRGVLALLNVWALVRVARSTDSIVFREKKTRSKGLVGFFFTLLLLSQFHLLFYASRTLPNFVALPVVNYALSKIVVGDLTGLTWLAFVGVVFRLEVGVFASVIAVVSSLVFGQSNIFHNVFMLAAGALVGLAVTYGVDSYFWGHSVVPELHAFYFNVVEGKSVEWGVEPYTAYFAKYLPNFFRPPHVLVLAAVGFLSDPAYDGKPMKFTEDSKLVITHPARNSLRILTLSAVLFIAAMSFQPHKEWRFIVYVIPVFTLLAANGLAFLWWRKSTLIAHKLLIFIMLASSVLAFAFSSYMGYASSYNYPGGAAIEYVNNLVDDNSSNVLIHMDVPACMTGITKFTELHRDNVVFDKTEDEKELAKIWNDVNYLITHKDMDQALILDLIVYEPSHWNKLTLVPAFAGVNVMGIMFSVQKFVSDEKFRHSFVKSVWTELTEGKFDTLEAFARNSVILRPYLHVYRRLEVDAIPVILDSEDKSSEEHKLEDAYDQERKHHEEIDLTEVTAEDVEEALSEQIDNFEDAQDKEEFERVDNAVDSETLESSTTEVATLESSEKTPEPTADLPEDEEVREAYEEEIQEQKGQIEEENAIDEEVTGSANVDEKAEVEESIEEKAEKIEEADDDLLKDEL